MGQLKQMHIDCYEGTCEASYWETCYMQSDNPSFTPPEQPEFDTCGYCGDRMFWNDEHDEDIKVCSQCLVKVEDSELEEMGLL